MLENMFGKISLLMWKKSNFNGFLVKCHSKFQWNESRQKKAFFLSGKTMSKSGENASSRHFGVESSSSSTNK